jgi:anti-anti-sigma factor
VPHDVAAADADPTADPGSVWVDAADPTLLRMSGEVDVAVIERLRDRVGADSPRGSELATHFGHVRSVDMSAVTFADSSAVGLLAGLVVGLEPTGERLVVHGIGPVVETVLEVTGLLPRLDVRP